MLDLGWSELLLIGIVALIVVGPKDLPVLFRNVGQWVGKARGMAREFSRAMNDAADSTGMKDVASTFKSATNPVGSALDGVKDAAKSMADPLKSVDPKSQTGKLSAEREAQRKKIELATAQKAAERMRKEAEAAERRAAELRAEAEATPAAPPEGTSAAPQSSPEQKEDKA